MRPYASRHELRKNGQPTHSVAVVQSRAVRADRFAMIEDLEARHRKMAENLARNIIIFRRVSAALALAVAALLALEVLR